MSDCAMQVIDSCICFSYLSKTYVELLKMYCIQILAATRLLLTLLPNLNLHAKASDIMSRYYRMTSHDVLHPIGWDSFGLPAEQFAIQTGTHPDITTKRNIDNFKRQLQMLGFSYDWEKEIATTDVGYVKWTQWIFLQLYKKGLARQSEVSVNWCPKLGTVLANEEVIDGLSERGDHPVIRLPLRQWVLKITDYADRLEKGLEGLDWPAGTMTAQEQWIGKSEGTEIMFDVKGMESEVSKFQQIA